MNVVKNKKKLRQNTFLLKISKKSLQQLTNA